MDSKLSCREARLILKSIPVRKEPNDMEEKEKGAIWHYVNCKRCRSLGLENILGREIPCQEAILVWAKYPGEALYENFSQVLNRTFTTLIELCAVEHVCGKLKFWDKNESYDVSTAFRKRPCRKLNEYWHDRKNKENWKIANEFPFLVELFRKEGWPLDGLLAVQKERIGKIIEDMKSGKHAVSAGSYRSMDDLVSEVEKYIGVLQELPQKAYLPREKIYMPMWLRRYLKKEKTVSLNSIYGAAEKVYKSFSRSDAKLLGEFLFDLTEDGVISVMGDRVSQGEKFHLTIEMV